MIKKSDKFVEWLRRMKVVVPWQRSVEAAFVEQRLETNTGVEDERDRHVKEEYALKEEVVKDEQDQSVKEKGASKEDHVMDGPDQHIKEEHASEEDKHVTVPTPRPPRLEIVLGPPADYGLVAMVRKDGTQVVVKKNSLK